MNLYIVRHVAGPYTWYRSPAKELAGGLDRGWATDINKAEVYTDDDFPPAFERMKVRVDIQDGKLVMG